MTVRFSRRNLLQYAAALSLMPTIVRADESDPWTRAADIARRVKVPVIPERRFDITDFGAKGDGVTLNTQAFAAAIDVCGKAGGGRVIVPAGRFLTGAIHLKSNMELHVSEEATVLFSTNTNDYPIVFTRYEGLELMNYSPLIYAFGEKNIAITGSGTLDGQGSNEHWWSWSGGARFGWQDGLPNQRAARLVLAQMAEDNIPVAQRIFGDGHYLRPNLIQTYNCDNVLIEGVKLRNSPCWNIHPVQCRNVIVRGVDVFGHGPNNDGCDPESVDFMLIEDCTFDTGDDCIAIKSGRNADGRRLATPAQNILIRNCQMKDGHGGVVIGSEISGGVRWVFAEKCRMDSPDLWYALRFKNNAMRGGVLENIYARDISVGQVGKAVITCDFNYEEGAKGAFKPVLRHVVVERLTADHALRVLDSQGLPGAPVSDIVLRDCRFDGVTEASIVTHTHDLHLENVQVNGRRVDKL
ncbi:glycoside hydrolase family 28 protein [Asticcacaulis sp.]|uniref:glycoside hydrolase family 28 protein n=1 Tax=Asticcacaulis sp. TaxID=1872648 RepID=UPI002BB24D44|nr:glycoside hydrolase family 28 protein [Asticcacaulis sp.]HTM82384.1 glycoside hydrolase family 28 protein [Asticcacaulis sp.]